MDCRQYIRLSKNTSFLCALVLLLSIAFISYFKEPIKHLIVTSFKYSLLSFSNEKDIDAPQTIFKAKVGNYGFIFDLNFIASSTDGYPNILQTANLNDGFRVEISGANVGFVIKNNDAPNGLYGNSITNQLINDAKNNLKVSYEPVESMLSIYLNHKEVFYKKVPVINSSDFIIGGGFNTDRNFKGIINKAHVEIYKINNYFKLLYYIAYIILFLIFLIIINSIPDDE